MKAVNERGSETASRSRKSSKEREQSDRCPYMRRKDGVGVALREQRKRKRKAPRDGRMPRGARG